MLTRVRVGAALGVDVVDLSAAMVISRGLVTTMILVVLSVITTTLVARLIPITMILVDAPADDEGKQGIALLSFISCSDT
jgi:hypothetical protein